MTASTRTIIRAVKDRSNPYVVVNNTVFTDDSLSWKGKGLMGYFLSRPDDWQITVEDLIRRSPDGRKAVYSGLRELIDRGYVVRTPVRNAAGNRIIRWEYLVYEVPQREPAGEPSHDSAMRPQRPETLTPQDFSLLAGFGQVENVQVQNAPQLNTEVLPSTELNQILKKKKNNNDRNRGAVAKDSTVNGTTRAKTAPPPAAVVVSQSVARRDAARVWDRWTAPQKSQQWDEVARTQHILRDYEQARRDAAPPEVALRYLELIGETLRRGGAGTRSHAPMGRRAGALGTR